MQRDEEQEHQCYAEVGPGVDAEHKGIRQWITKERLHQVPLCRRPHEDGSQCGANESPLEFVEHRVSVLRPKI